MEKPPPIKTSSGRDTKKAKGQSAALGGNKPVRQPHSYYLVVCGGTNVEEGWLFSDFMGYCMMLREFGVEGDFYSCFPLSDHFIWLNNDNTPSIHNIKFGRYGPDGKALYTYTRHQWCAREYWWTQVSPKTIYDRFKDWILKKQKETEPGDTANIILTGHGTVQGTFCIGNDFIRPATFVHLLSEFKDGVQVNAVSDACYSGTFVDVIKTSDQKCRYFSSAARLDQKAWSDTRSLSGRLRNGRFAAAFVQSMARMKLPGTEENPGGWRIRDHEEFMKAEIMRKLGPNSRESEPQFWSSSDIDRASLLLNLLFHDTIDIAYDLSAVARRRRKEWPTSDKVVRQALSSACNKITLPAETKALIDSELARCSQKTLYTPDLGVYTEPMSKAPNWRAILRNLYWRGRRQSAVWDVYELLVGRSFVNPKCLQIPMDLLSTSQDVGIVVKLLACFSGVGEASVEIARGHIPKQFSEWVADIEWLATVIVRSGADLGRLFETIEASQFLGCSEEEELALFKEIYPEVKTSQAPRDREGSLAPNGEVPPESNVFGFWLPHGLEENDPEAYASQLRACQQRFNAIERAFKEVEGILPHDLVLENEQGISV